jgi:hypothetical protein
MNLEVGKTYRTRRGEQALIVYEMKNPSDKRYQFVCVHFTDHGEEMYCHDQCGSFCGYESSWDLIEEVRDEKP